MSLHTYDFDVSQAPGPRLFLEEGVLQMQQQQQQENGSNGDAESDAAAAAAQAAQAAAAAAALARKQKQLAATSFRSRGGRYPSRAHTRLDAAALLAATDGGDADDAETFSTRAYSSEFEEHPDLATTWAVDKNFLDAFARGFSLYRMGQWEEAREALERTLRWPKGGGSGGGGGSGSGASGGNETESTFSGPPDGPSAALLRFMEAHKFVPPKAWRGFRELTEK
jgi:tetratricopeptide (TPR) repeat protein